MKATIRVFQQLEHQDSNQVFIRVGDAPVVGISHLFAEWDPGYYEVELSVIPTHYDPDPTKGADLPDYVEF